MTLILEMCLICEDEQVPKLLLLNTFGLDGNESTLLPWERLIRWLEIMNRVKIRDIILIHDDTPRIKWKFAVIEGVNKGADGLIRSADIQTTTGKLNWPIARLYPLEMTASETAKRNTSQINITEPSTSSAIDTDVPAHTRQVRDAAKKGRVQIKQWTTLLRGPPEDVTDSD